MMGQTSIQRGPARGGDAAPVLTVVRGTEDAARPDAIRTLRFGDFQLATESGELERAGEPVKLQPQPAKLLQYLAERSGRVVSRRELQVHLWGENRFVDSDQGLNYCVKSIRRALGDSAESPTYLETVPRRGYRFRSPVEIVGVPLTHPAPPAAPTAESNRSRMILPVSIVLAVVVTAAWALWHFGARDAGGPARIAVLPFENLSQQGEDEALVTGLTAELISRLVREHGTELAVIARTSAMAYAGTTKPVAEIGAELDVDLLLTGTVRRSGQALRVSTQLIEVAGETVRWAEVFERPASDSAWEAWTSKTTSAVAGELGLEPAETVNPAFELPAELYDLYLRGISSFDLETAEGIQQGLETLAEVRRRAPGFAPAHLAWARLRTRTGPARGFLPEVMAALERAVDLDPDFVEAHLEITRLRGLYLYEWRRGEEHVQHALELRPRLADAHRVHAMYLAAAGKVDEAIAAMHRALVIDPLSRATSAHAAWSYFFARRYERAIEVSRRTLELDPASPAGHSTIIHSMLQLGETDDALAQARLMAGSELGSLEEYWRLEIEESPASPGLHAIWQVQLGEHDAAIDSLLRACREQVGWPLPFLRVDARFDPIRQHPRFAEVLACTGLAEP